MRMSCSLEVVQDLEHPVRWSGDWVQLLGSGRSLGSVDGGRGSLGSIVGGGGSLGSLIRDFKESGFN